MDNTDNAGFPLRKFGDRLVIDGKQAVVLENRGLFALCPCGDLLLVRFTDNTEKLIENNNFETW